MIFASSDFDSCWQHICSRAREDQESGEWIATRTGRQGNRVIDVTEKAIRLRSKRPSGKGWRDIPRREFQREWEELRAEATQTSTWKPNQVTGAIIVRYFEDMFWAESGWIDSNAIPDTDDSYVTSGDAGPSPYERRPPMEIKAAEGHHRAIWAALNLELYEREGWQEVGLPADSRLRPDKLVYAEEIDSGLFFEIKSRGAMADVYEGVGQLLIYSKLYPVGEGEPLLVLILPEPPADAEVQLALEANGIVVLPAVLEDEAWVVPSLSSWLDSIL